MGRGDEVARSGSPCTPGRRERCLRRQPGMWWSWRTVFLAVLGGVAAAAMEATECSYETTLDELGGGSHEVSVDVSHTFDGVPAADQSCPQGELECTNTHQLGFDLVPIPLDVVSVGACVAARLAVIDLSGYNSPRALWVVHHKMKKLACIPFPAPGLSNSKCFIPMSGVRC